MNAPFLSDRRRVELALPARLLWSPAHICLSEEKPEEKAVLDDLRAACVEPLRDLDAERSLKVAARIDRVCQELLDPYKDRPVATVFLIVLFWLKQLLDEGRLTLVEGSSFDRAVTQIIEGVGEHADVWDAVEKSASKNAKRLNERLSQLGYYGG